MHKRDFLKFVLATCAARIAIGEITVSREPRWALRPNTERITLVYDQRYDIARAMSVDLQSAPVGFVPTNGDVGSLWYSNLKPTMTHARVLLAGITPYSEFEVLRSMATELHKNALLEVRHMRGRKPFIALNQLPSTSPLVSMLSADLLNRERSAEHAGLLVTWLIG